jgi:hypothetical protein
LAIGLVLVGSGAGDLQAAESNTNGAPATALPVRGLHLMAPNKSEIPAFTAFIRETLPKAGVNTLILEFNFHFDFKSRPEFADATAPGKEDVRQIVQACRGAGVELIPQINCLGHQSWAKRNGRLLQKHPELDETPGKYPDNEGIYCRSYCPLHPEVHKVLFPLMDELAAACEAKSFHVGMDEVFILADPDCPRCKGKPPAALFADEAKTLRAHLQQIGCRTWMWGDRLLDGKATRLGKWEASENGTASAIGLLPKDIVICDWHYNRAPETPIQFAQKGFDVVACPWRKPDVALAQLAEVRTIRSGTDPEVSRHALGLVQTTWGNSASFIAACRAREAGAPAPNPGAKDSASEAAQCFEILFRAMQTPPSNPNP